MITFYIGAPGKSKEKDVCKAFCVGFGAQSSRVFENKPVTYPAAFYGVTEITRPVYEGAVRDGGDFYYIDNGYFGHGDFFRITKNAPQHTGIGPGSFEKFARHGVKIKPWTSNGSHIVVTTQSEYWYTRHGTTLDDWVDGVTRKLRENTDREIRVRTKPKSVTSPQVPFEKDLNGAWAVVTHSSNTAVDAILAGVPAFVTHPCAALAMGSDDLSQIEAPRRPDGRDEWAYCLASNQWSLEEIASGEAASYLGAV